MPTLWDEIERDLNWMRLALDIWDPRTPRPLAKELRWRMRVMKSHIDQGRQAPAAVRRSGKGVHVR